MAAQIEVMNRLNEVLRTFTELNAAVDFARPLATIPGDYITLVVYAQRDGEWHIADIMCWGL